MWERPSGRDAHEEGGNLIREPHSRNLRAHRIIATGIVYSVSTRVLESAAAFTEPEGQIVISALAWLRTSGRARVYGFAVMPDHLHVLIQPVGSSVLPEVMRSLKGFTGYTIQKRRGRRGAFWQNGYFEHAVRTAEEAISARTYIEANPVRAALVIRPEEYPLSSACSEQVNCVDPIS